jgi:DNA-binding transcriptional MerR regulator
MKTPTQVAKQANVTAQTIRNYSTDYGALLSPSARGDAGPRLYSDEDVQILCTIAALRKSGIPPAEIAERIHNETAPSVIDLTPNAVSNAPQNGLKEGRSDVVSPQMVLSTINGRFEAIERRIEARERQAHLWTLGTGVWIGMVLMAAIFFAVWITVNGL